MTVPKVKTKQVRGERWYVIDPDDPTKTVPGVSSITGMMPKNALMPAAVKETAAFVVRNQQSIATMSRGDAFEWIKGAYRREWNKKADLGTEVHAAVEQIDRALIAGRKPKFAVRDEIVPYLRNYARFVKEFAVKPLMVETTVFNETVGYAGTADGFKYMTLPTGETALFDVDTKSGASGVWAEAGLQQTAYTHGEFIVDEDGELAPMPEELVADKAYALWLRPEGFALLPLDTGPESWQQFQRLRESFQWKTDHEESVVGKPINEIPIKRGYRPPDLG